ncbi:MAG: magnesium transporter CorA family protein [Sphaerochaetaceae bacterium]|nr:magnesium transporter CorA family protein [Sphaerochaetaceae bacterium]
MITIRNNIVSRIPGDIKRPANYTWVDARDINRDDIARLEEEFAIDSELLADIMDPDEQARIEKEDDYTALIVRLPAKDDDVEGVNQYAIPLGIVMFEKMLITICQSDSIVLEDFARKRFRQYPVETKEGFVISIMERSALVYIRLLKYINRQKNQVEEKLTGNVQNRELLQLQQIQKSLVFFKTSLTTNEMLLEKLQKSPYFKLTTEEEMDFLEDTITDTKQAISMADIYSDLLRGTMEVFSSVIGNNMNEIMKRLTIITIALMFPTFIVGFYGMNIALPFDNVPHIWQYLLLACVISAFLGSFILSDRRNNSPKKDRDERLKDKHSKHIKKEKKTKFSFFKRKKSKL